MDLKGWRWRSNTEKTAGTEREGCVCSHRQSGHGKTIAVAFKVARERFGATAVVLEDGLGVLGLQLPSRDLVRADSHLLVDRFEDVLDGLVLALRRR